MLRQELEAIHKEYYVQEIKQERVWPLSFNIFFLSCKPSTRVILYYYGSYICYSLILVYA